MRLQGGSNSTKLDKKADGWGRVCVLHDVGV